MKRPRTSAFVGTSLDGFLASKDGTLDWLKPFEELERGYTAFFASIDTLLIGRATYDFVLSMVRDGLGWPYGGKRCWVLTHRPVDGAHGERAVTGGPAELLGQLQQEGAQHVYVDGGVVVRAFLAQGLLDALTVTLVPVILGEGIPLLGGVKPTAGLTLEGTTSFPDGVVQLRYRLVSG